MEPKVLQPSCPLQLPGMVPRNASERSKISSLCASQEQADSGIHNGEGFRELEVKNC